MSIPKIYKAPFFENGFYHIYNRTNNNEKLFLNDSDKTVFLKKFTIYTNPFLDIFSWNLLQNHFHFYIRVKSIDGIMPYLKNMHKKNLCKTEKKFLKNENTLHDLIDNVFKRFFIAYSTFINITYGRKGNLFHRPFKHMITQKENQLTNTIIYINANAVKHNLVPRIEDYKWSSYHKIISNDPTEIPREEILDWFGGKSEFIKLHKEKTEYYQSCENLIDDY